MDSNLNKRPSLESLFNDFHHPNPYINHESFAGMVEYWPNESMKELLELLQNDDLIIRRKSIEALSKFGEEIFAPIVKLFYSNSSKVLKISCLKILVKVFSQNEFASIPDKIFLLIDKASEDNSPEMILMLIALLRQIGNKGLEKLFQLSVDNNILRSKAAIMALGEMNNPSIEIHFKNLLDNESIDPMIRESLKIAMDID